MSDVINVWMSAYGEFPIPDEIYKKTKWEEKKVMGYEGEVITYDPTPDSVEFINWLHEQEVKAGKIEV